jgi:hypothetical protein
LETSSHFDPAFRAAADDMANRVLKKSRRGLPLLTDGLLPSISGRHEHIKHSSASGYSFRTRLRQFERYLAWLPSSTQHSIGAIKPKACPHMNDHREAADADEAARRIAGSCSL